MNAKLTWKDPTTPMTGVELAMRVVGAPGFTKIANVPKGTQTLDVPDLVDGAYEFRAVVENGVAPNIKRSPGIIVAATIVTTPGDVTTFAASIT